MIVTGQFDVQFKAIHAANFSNSGRVLILCAPDCDALCAYRILTRLLESQPTQFEGVPVRRLDDLVNANNVSVASSSQHSSLILLNCGAVYDLESIFSLSDSQVVYVIDSHRPFHLNNVYSKKIVLMDDGTGTEEVNALSSEIDNANGDADDDKEMEDDDSEEEDEVFDSDEEEEYNFGNGGREPPRQRLRLDSIVQRQSRRRRIKRYYSKSYHGPCSAILAYTIAQELNRTDNELLWCAIVGLTDQFIHERIDFRRYSSGVELLKDEVLSRNAALVDLNKATMIDEGRTSLRRADDVISFHPKEQRFVLLQHWNIFESMSNSRYIFSALGLWKESGRSRLKELFVKMGISLDQSRQDYRSMDIGMKDLFHKHIQSYAKEEFGIDNIVFGSFTRQQQGVKMPTSASDIVYCVTTLLEHPYNLESEGNVGDATDDAIWKINFWKAYEALSGREPMFSRGVNITINLQHAITEQASSILEKKTLIKSGPFRYAYLTENINVFFLKPIPLVQLAYFLLDTLKHQKKVEKPLIICALNEASNTFLVVGVSPTRDAAVFSSAFKKASEMTPQQPQVRLTCFDSWVVEVSKPFIQRFMFFIHVALASG